MVCTGGAAFNRFLAVSDLGNFATSELGTHSPQGLAFDSSGNLYAANKYIYRIEKFSPTGVDLGVFANTGNSTYGIAFDSSGNLYTANDTHSVEKFGPTGTDLGVFASGSRQAAGRCLRRQR